MSYGFTHWFMCRSGPLDTLMFTTTISVISMYSTSRVVVVPIIWLYITVFVVVISFSIIVLCGFILQLMLSSLLYFQVVSLLHVFPPQFWRNLSLNHTCYEKYESWSSSRCSYFQRPFSFSALASYMCCINLFSDMPFYSLDTIWNSRKITVLYIWIYMLSNIEIEDKIYDQVVANTPQI
jgi:hypothetical protein